MEPPATRPNLSGAEGETAEKEATAATVTTSGAPGLLGWSHT